MKKHTVKFELDSDETLTFYSSEFDDYINDEHGIDLCVEGLREFLQFSGKMPKTLYVTISSRKFKNSFPIKLIQHSRLKNLLEGVIVDERKILSGVSLDVYLKERMGSFKNNPTIHVLFETE